MTPSLHTIPPFLQKRLRRYEVNGYVFHTVLVEKGSFRMGGEDSEAYGDEKPIHEVTITQDYELGIHPVTQGLWRAVMGSDWPKLAFVGDERPMERVSWEDVCGSGGFLEKLNARLQGSPAGSSEGRFALPTEAQWEYAARGGRYHARAGHLYAGSSRLEEVGWYRDSDNSGQETQAVGHKQANVLGFYDMSWNVWEYCGDWYGDYSAGAQTDPKGPVTGVGRVLRGGGWIYEDGLIRVSNRGLNTPSSRTIGIGFRVARQF
jgi:formylglycine-generating enzyme required for sulfatase activity